MGRAEDGWMEGLYEVALKVMVVILGDLQKMEVLISSKVSLIGNTLSHSVDLVNCSVG